MLENVNQFVKDDVMSIENKIKSFKNIDMNDYPELKGYSSCHIYEDFIGCGGLYLLTKMIRKMNLKKGDIILDLGCGMGSSSIYLAKHFDITIIAVDYWNSPDILNEKAKLELCSNRIIPLQIDITQEIPFPKEYFDAILCMNSLFMLGERIEVLKNIISTLKIGGSICIGSECFNKEPDFTNITQVPTVYNFDWHWNVWENCYSKYHSPMWWCKLFESTKMLDIVYCEELDDGKLLFEDFVLNYDIYVSDRIRDIGAVIPKEKIAQQIIYGYESGLYPSLYILKAFKFS